jgi:hypothetical protein
MSERRNAWGRGPDGAERATTQPSLAEDQKTKFDRHAEVVAAQRADTSAHDARVQKIEDKNAEWVHKKFRTTAAGGTPLPADLAKQKVASDASRTAPKAAPVSVDLETLAALIRDWKNGASGKNYLELFEQNPWTREQMNNIMQSLIQQGHPVNAALPEKTFQIAYAGNHLDPRKRTDRAGNTIRLRGEARRPAPVPFPRVIWPDEADAMERERQENAVAAAAAETVQAKSLTFDELRREAVKNRKTERPLMGPGW